MWVCSFIQIQFTSLQIGVCWIYYSTCKTELQGICTENLRQKQHAVFRTDEKICRWDIPRTRSHRLFFVKSSTFCRLHSLLPRCIYCIETTIMRNGEQKWNDLLDYGSWQAMPRQHSAEPFCTFYLNGQAVRFGRLRFRVSTNRPGSTWSCFSGRSSFLPWLSIFSFAKRKAFGV